MYRLSGTLRIVPARDGQVVLDITRGQILHLNATAALIVDRLQQGQTESQIAEAIGQQFHAPQETVNADIEEFLTSLERRGLVFNDSNPRTAPERPLQCDSLSGKS